jgi:LmbE family N-acetylglucosaminyl deacetylase
MVLGRIRRLTRASMRGVARDATGGTATRSALVLAPHPDDETLGCGATILRKTAAGTPVVVAVVTDGRHSHRSDHLSPDQLAALRKVEMAEAGSRLGLPPEGVLWGGFVDGTLSDRLDDVTAYVGALLAELRPDEVYTTCVAEPHPDHSALGRAARAAVAAAAHPVRLLEYPVWLWGSWPLRRGERIQSAVAAARTIARRGVTKVDAGEHLAGKLRALEAHASQLRRPDEVPADADWAALPPDLLAAAAEPAELFLPWHGTARDLSKSGLS